MRRTALNERQSRFAEEYLVDLNATKAAVRAGYSPRSARSQGSALLARPAVRERIDAGKRERSRETGVTAAHVVEELARIAFADPEALLSAPPPALTPGEAAGETPRGIAGVKVKYTPKRAAGADGGTEYEVCVEREVRVGDKLRALEMLAKHLGVGERPAEPADDGARCGVVVLPPVMTPTQPPEA